MKKFTVAGLALMTAAFLHSCRPFCQCEPIPMESFRCKIINPQGQSLIVGPQALFRPDSIKVLKNRNAVSVSNASVSKSSSDSSVLFFDFYGPETKSFVYYNRQTGNDSLEIVWKATKEKCCGEPFTHHSIVQARFNGAPVQPQNGLYVLVKP